MLIKLDSSLLIRGVDDTRKKWESHWNTAVLDEDLHELTEVAGRNHVRVPVGYFTLGPEFCRHTPFAMQPAQVYVNAWKAVKELSQRCYKHGVGVLIILQVVPDGVNNDVNAVSIGSGSQAWEQKFYLELTKRCLVFIAQEVSLQSELNSVVGVQICEPANQDTHVVYDWYNDVVAEISSIEPSLPVYISDEKSLDRALQWSASKNTFGNDQKCPVVVNVLRNPSSARTDADTTTTFNLDMALASVTANLDDISKYRKGQVAEREGVVAVYLGGHSRLSSNRSMYDALSYHRSIHEFISDQAQLRTLRHVLSGSAAGTMKTGQDNHHSGSPTAHVCNDVLALPKYVFFTADEIGAKLREVDRKRGRLLSEAMKKHVAQFVNASGRHEFWRYADGWHLGYADARAFFAFRFERLISATRNICQESVVGVDTIGTLDIWILKRLKQQHQIDRGKARARKIGQEVGENDNRCESAWVWETGFRDGLQAFNNVVGAKTG